MGTNERFPGNFGARRAYFAWQNGGAAAVNDQYDATVFTHQLMASETQEGVAPTLKYHGRPIPPSEWFEHPTTGIGAWGLFLSLSRSMPADAAWSLALTWRGDLIYIYQGAAPSEDTALIWQLETADEASASALESQLKLATPSAEVRRIGTFVTFAISTAPVALDWAFVAQ
jgi:hypothetical protein